MILITGNCRSGTGYIAKLLQAFGYDIGHEITGTDGISDYKKAIPSEITKYRTVIHIVRHPIFVISSMTTIMDRSWNFIFKHIPKPGSISLLYKCMYVWYYWNVMINKSYHVHTIHRFKIEDMPDAITTLLPPRIPEFELPKKGYNTRPHQLYTWDDLYNENTVLAMGIETLGKKYGYS